MTPKYKNPIASHGRLRSRYYHLRRRAKYTALIFGMAVFLLLACEFLHSFLPTKAAPLADTNADLDQYVFFNGTNYIASTTEANNATANDFTLASTTTTGSPAAYFGMNYKFDQLKFDIGTLGVGGAVAWEYWNGTAWTSLTATDNTANFTASGTVSFTIPTDWQTTDPDGAGSVTSTLYWVRARTTTGYISTGWTETQPAGDKTISWDLTASNSDGSRLIAGACGGRLYLSSDYGATWTETRPAGDVDKCWDLSDSSADGQHLIVGVYGGRLYISSDYGATWTETRPAGDVDKAWWPSASNSDGSRLIVGDGTSGLYISSDYGATWTETKPAGEGFSDNWRALASNSDGSRLIVGVTIGRVYLSSDYGATWTETRPAGDVDKYWGLTASNSDGSRLIVGSVSEFEGGRLYISSDYGATWTETRPAGDVDKAWTPVTSSSNGSHLFVGYAGYNRGRLYLSSDYGATWTETRPAGDAGWDWWEAASNSDGSRLIIGSYGGSLGRLYIYLFEEKVPLGTQVSARAYNLKVKVQRETDSVGITGLTADNFTISDCADTTKYGFREIGLGVYDLALLPGQTCNYNVSEGGYITTSPVSTGALTTTLTDRSGTPDVLLFGLKVVPADELNNVVNLDSMSTYQDIILAESGLASYWKMDNNWTDSKGANDGTATGATFGAAKYGEASGSFDGNSDATMGTNILNFTSAVSVEAWIKETGDNTNGAAIVDNSNGGWGNGYGLSFTDPNTIIFFINNGWGGYEATFTLVNDGEWHHVVGTYDGVTIRIYVDGVEGTPYSYSTPIIPCTTAFKLGRGGGGNFTGLVDEVAVYNTALSAGTIESHFISGTPADTLIFRSSYPSVTSSNIHYWTDTSGTGALSIQKDGYVAGETTNNGLSDITTSALGQIALTLGIYDPASSAITSSSNIKGLQYAGKVTLNVSGATVTAGDSYGTTCSEDGTTKIYYCAIPLANTSTSIQVVKSGYIAATGSFASDRVAHTDSQQTATINLVSSQTTTPALSGGSPGAFSGGGPSGAGVPAPVQQTILPDGTIVISPITETIQSITESIAEIIAPSSPPAPTPPVETPASSLPEKPSTPTPEQPSTQPSAPSSLPSFPPALQPLSVPFSSSLFTNIITEAKASFNQTVEIVRDTYQEVKKVANTPAGKVTTKAAVVVPVAVAVAEGVAATMLPSVATTADLYSVLARMLGLLAEGLGIRKRVKKWGVVYDSKTKRPIDPAHVKIIDENGKVVSERFTDMEGRFGFLVPPGRYKIEASKTHYSFPSKLKTKRDELYDNLYYGETLDIKSSIADVNIPMDPMGIDWNEEIKKKIMSFDPNKEILKKRITQTLFLAGFILSPLVYWVTPSPFNLAVIFFYFLVLTLKQYGFRPKTFGRIYGRETGKPMPFAKIKVSFADNPNQIIASSVSDITGRYYILVAAKGSYLINVEGKSLAVEAPEKVINFDLRV